MLSRDSLRRRGEPHERLYRPQRHRSTHATRHETASAPVWPSFSSAWHRVGRRALRLLLVTVLQHHPHEPFGPSPYRIVLNGSDLHRSGEGRLRRTRASCPRRCARPRIRRTSPGPTAPGHPGSGGRPPPGGADARHWAADSPRWCDARLTLTAPTDLAARGTVKLRSASPMLLSLSGRSLVRGAERPCTVLGAIEGPAGGDSVTSDPLGKLTAPRSETPEWHALRLFGRGRRPDMLAAAGETGTEP